MKSIILMALAVAAFDVSATCVPKFMQAATPGSPTHFFVCDLAADTPSSPSDGDLRYDKDTDGIQSYNGAVWAAVGGGGGGAPTTAKYITQIPDAGLSAEQAMSALPTGLVLNATVTGVQSTYAGATCGGTDKATALSAAGALTCSAVTYASVTGTPTIPTASALLDTIGSLQGSILERGATNWQTITPGPLGSVLTSLGPGADPLWNIVPKALPTRQGLPKPYCNSVRRANLLRTNCQ